LKTARSNSWLKENVFLLRSVSCTLPGCTATPAAGALPPLTAALELSCAPVIEATPTNARTNRLFFMILNLLRDKSIAPDFQELF
jgi:hypothetical protein